MQQPLAGEDEGTLNNVSDPVCSGPYNQIISQSLSLGDVSKSAATPNSRHCKWLLIKAYQFTDSGDTVCNSSFNFVQALHNAFSSLAPLLYAFRFDKICFQEDQMSSSFQLYDK